MRGPQARLDGPGAEPEGLRAELLKRAPVPSRAAEWVQQRWVPDEEGPWMLEPAAWAGEDAQGPQALRPCPRRVSGDDFEPLP